MKINSRPAAAGGSASRRAGAPASALAALAPFVLLAGCAGDPAPQRAASPAGDPQALAAELDALQRQPGPASDEVIASLERALRELREKRARAVVAAGTTSVIPSSASDGPAVTGAPLKSPAPATTTPPPVAAAPAPARPPHPTRAQARAASAAAARQSAAAKQNAPVPELELAANATPLPPLHPVEQPMAATIVMPTAAAAATGPDRTPMSRIGESHMPVDELYARARELELRAQVVAAIGLYREASQRGHAPSSQRLMELYADGAPGVARDYRVAVFFKERAVQQGASFDPAWRR